jgi:hypothetical protein
MRLGVLCYLFFKDIVFTLEKSLLNQWTEGPILQIGKYPVILSTSKGEKYND